MRSGFSGPKASQDKTVSAANYIVVNQGDTVELIFLNNDTVIHNFVIGAPYFIEVNASVPGLINDLTGAKVTGPATNNSPGVVVTGSPGSVTARYNFVAQYAGIYEFVCTYHVSIGMFGYLVVLPNGAYQPTNTTALTTPDQSSYVECGHPSRCRVP